MNPLHNPMSLVTDQVLAYNKGREPRVVAYIDQFNNGRLTYYIEFLPENVRVSFTEKDIDELGYIDYVRTAREYIDRTIERLKRNIAPDSTLEWRKE